MAVPKGADKKLQERQRAREIKQRNAARKHAWKKDKFYQDPLSGSLKNYYKCKRSGCRTAWTREYSANGRECTKMLEPIGCYGKGD